MNNLHQNINSFDFDGVICMGKGPGVYPGPHDVIITGRSHEEKEETLAWLARWDITNAVFFAPWSFDNKTRLNSGAHKAEVIMMLSRYRWKVGIHFEDDPIQAEVIKQHCSNVKVVLLEHDLVNKENVRRDGFGKEIT